MSKPFLGAVKVVLAGQPTVIESNSPDEQRGVVFEDDGETGYFYARDYSISEMPTVDAVHIYTVKNVVREHVRIRIIWSQDMMKAALLIDDLPHATFNFIERIGYCRDEFPDPNPDSGWKRQGWDDGLREWFYPETDKSDSRSNQIHNQ